MTHHPREHNKRTMQRHRVPRRPRRRTSARQRNQHRHDILIRLAPKVERIRMLGSAAIDLAWVAAGRLDASIMLANKPWDVSAGVLIARESGALVPDIDGTQNSREVRVFTGSSTTAVMKSWHRLVCTVQTICSTTAGSISAVAQRLLSIESLPSLCGHW